MSVEIPGLRQAPIPRLVHVKQTFPSEHLSDVTAEMRRALEGLWPPGSPGATALNGKRIGISVGSRGITDIDRITKVAVDFLLAAGCQPFIFPAMGSHGGGTAEGQTAMIASYGVTPEKMGCPIEADMETSVLGVFDGVEVHCARVAFESDGILLLNRVKPHTDICKPPNAAVVGFDVGGVIGSGLSKICAIGAGKLEGAKAYHNHVLELGLETAIVVATRELIRAGRVAGGIAIIENAYHRTAKLAAVPADPDEPSAFFRLEAQLHAEAKSLMPSLPIPLARWPPPVTLDPARPDALYDVLFCRDIGKDISGAGMDTNIIGRGAYEMVPGKQWQHDSPSINRIVASNVSEGAHGNPGGPGLADFCTQRLLSATDFKALYLNQVTSYSTLVAKMPIALENDRVAIAAALATTPPRLLGRRFCAIKDTLSLEDVLVSESCVPLLEGLPHVQIVGDAFEATFDEDGYLLFPFEPRHHL